MSDRASINSSINNLERENSKLKKEREQYEKMITKINEAIKAIENAEFSINPKVIDNKNIGCEFCKFKDICYKKEEDMNNLKSVNYQDFLNDN